MRDVTLFRLLREEEREPNAAELASLLSELAELPWTARSAFLGSLDRALGHGDPKVRAAAVSVLGGAEGLVGIRAIVGALDDGDAHVARAAVSALKKSATGPGRWAHALFHRNAAVRSEALRVGAPRDAEAWPFYLLADPTSVDTVRALPLSVPSGALPTLLAFVSRGVVSREEARKLVAAIPWQVLAVFVERARARPAPDIEAILASDGAAPPKHEDEIDELFRLFMAEDTDAALAATFFENVERRAFSALPFRQRVLASVMSISKRLGWFLPRAAELCAALHPPFLLAPWVPRDVRHAAIEGLHRWTRGVPRFADDRVKDFLKSDDLVRLRGRYDPWALGGLLYLATSPPYQLLFTVAKPDEVVDACHADFERAVSLLVHADASEHGRKFLLERLVARAPSRRGEVLALLVRAAKADELDFLESLDPDGAKALLDGLLSLEERAPDELPRNKIDPLADVLLRKFFILGPRTFLVAWLDRARPEGSRVGLAMLGELAKRMDTGSFVDTCVSLDTARLRRLVEALPHATHVPYGKERALAERLLGHTSPAIHAWAEERVPLAGALPPPPRHEGSRALTASEVDTIATATDADLEAALAPCFGGPGRGLTRALARRPTPPLASAAACAALLACEDDVDDVSHAFDRFGSTDPAFAGIVDMIVVRYFRDHRGLPLHGHAWLYRHELHAFGATHALAGGEGGLAGGLARALVIPSTPLRLHVFRAAMRAIEIWRWRDRVLLETAAEEPLVDFCVAQLDTELGETCARILVALHQARVCVPALASHEAAIRDGMVDFDDATRSALATWISGGGLPGRAVAARARRTDPSETLLAEIRGSPDIDALIAWCSVDDPKIAHEATLRLVELGEVGLHALAALLATGASAAGLAVVTESIGLWPEGPWFDALGPITDDASRPPVIRFRIALALVERGDFSRVRNALAAATEETSELWVRREDADRLFAVFDDVTPLARSLAASPHHHLYRRAVELLLSHTPPLAAEDRRALAEFLEAGSDRIGDLRRRAARALFDAGDSCGLPVLVDHWFRTSEDTELMLRLSGGELRMVVDAALTAGNATVPEQRVLDLVDHASHDRKLRDELVEHFLLLCEKDNVRLAAVQRLRRRPSRAKKLLRVAQTFAWGVRRGRELTGRIFRFHMISNDALGWTRLATSDIHVNALPLLRAERHGREVVEGLCLHEIGHHVYHRGKENAEVWGEAQRDGLGGLLNLVADEHLERNLRATDADWGDRLKLLAAYAFQHSDREIAVARLLDMLQAGSFEVLSRTRLGVARNPACVRVDNGALLAEMERIGLGFAKFVRALRMGLGSRHDDERVNQGLALFGKKFRKGDMRSLLAVTHALREIFGDETRIVECFGGHETIGGEPSDGIIHGEGIDDDELQREIERVLDPRSASRDGASGMDRGGKLVLNVNPDERYDLITEVRRIPYEADRHREVGRGVARHARRMRQFLEELGLTLEPERFRLRGRRFDRSRATAVVTRGDPRMLIAREPRVKTDLFLGVIVDCSGSMHGNSMERARAFGVLLADAARGIRGVDVRLFGFTDQVIYDAGDSKYPAVASLEAGGGNNDAAALHHTASVARRSKRRAKLLVMISDGLPTECSVAALRGLVRHLTKREGMCCAQVAVRPISDVCFPNYVEVLDDDLDASVRKFGRIAAGLVRKALGSG